MILRHVCNCSATAPCDTAAKLFDRSEWRRLAAHLEQTIQKNRPYPEAERPRAITATIADTRAGAALRELRGRL